MRRLFVYLSMMVVAGMMALNLTSCGDDPVPAPTVKIDVQKDGHKVVIAVLATDVNSYEWDYGDGNKSTASGSHEYTYEYSGDYVINVKVTGDGGTAFTSANVTIDPEPSEILAGTPKTHPNGKTWVLDPKYHAGKNGAGPLIPALTITYPFLVDNVLEVALNMGAEYDNEFTFKYDGSLVINNKNGVSFGSQMYSFAVAQTGPAPGFEGGNGLCGIAYTPKANGKYELKKGDLNMDVVIEDPANLGAGWQKGKLALTNQMYIEPTDYFGFLEITKTVLVKSITSEQMDVMFFMHGVVQEPMLPSTAIHVSFIPKK